MMRVVAATITSIERSRRSVAGFLFVTAALLMNGITVCGDDVKSVVEKHSEAIVKNRDYAAVVVGVHQNGGDCVYTFGKWDGKAPDRDSVFEIGSVTKVFTGTLLADAVVRGEVKLDDPVQKHLPNGWTMPRRDGRDITLLQLATHTSGLTRQPYGFLAVALKHSDNPFAHYDIAEMKKGLPQTKVQWASGAKYEYSNLGVGLLGHALANAAKMVDYETLLKQRILGPMEMKDSQITLVESEKARIIPGHNAAGKKQPTWTFACMESCGALRSTTADLLRFVGASCKTEGVLQRALEMAQQNWREIAAEKVENGLCWVRKIKKGSPTQIWHNGQTGGYHSFVGFIPGKGGVVVLCNVAIAEIDEVGFRVLDKIAEGS